MNQIQLHIGIYFLIVNPERTLTRQWGYEAVIFQCSTECYIKIDM